MRVLLTNDDGVTAKGMDVLREIAAQISDDVWVVAPATEQSATSRSVSLHNPVMAKEIDDKVYAVTGTPTDSVIVALCDIMKDNMPDLILSGVNRGQNMAEDVTFSGTVAGALEGTQLGVPSIALSMAKGFQGARSLPWETAIAHGPALITKLVKNGWPKNVTLNVNFPDRAPDNVEGTMVTRQGKRDHQMSGVDKRSYPRGGSYFWLTYGAALSNPPQGTDLQAIYDGYISVTPLHTDLTHFDTLSDLQDAFTD